MASIWESKITIYNIKKYQYIYYTSIFPKKQIKLILKNNFILRIYT